jgi:hypothetical protein
MELRCENNGSVYSMCIKHGEIKAKNVCGVEISTNCKMVELMSFTFRK